MKGDIDGGIDADKASALTISGLQRGYNLNNLNNLNN